MRQQNAFSGRLIRNLVDEFTEKFPKLQDPDHAIGRCKFYSMRLTGYLRDRGFPAHCYHVQHVKDKKQFPDAHAQWREKPAAEWTHYVVRVGSIIIDVTSRQLDPKGDHPLFLRYSELKDLWNEVSRDKLVTDVANELHTRHGVHK